MSSLVNPLSYQLGDTGVILNDDLIAPGYPFVDIATVKGLDSAPFRETKRDHEGVDGGFLDAEFETGRDITLDGTIYSNGTYLESYLDSLKANFAPVTSPIPFYLLTETGEARLLFVKPRGVHYDWDVYRRLGYSPAQFLMYAEDPRIYSANLQTFTLPVGALTFSGFGFSLGFPFGFGGSSLTTDGQYVTNSGNRPAPAILTVAPSSGTLSNPTIVNDTTGNTLTFIIDITFPDQLVIDLGNHTVRLNGVTNRRNTLQAPDWFLLSPGQQFIRFRADAGTGNLTIQFRSAWR